MVRFDIRHKLFFADGQADLSVKLSLPKQSFTALCGSSGAGKTTLLRILAGLVTPDTGLIESGDDTWLNTEQRINKPPQQRKIGFVFQDYALFPNMTVRGNLQFASTQKNDPFIDELLERIMLSDFAESKPKTLSGGQRQRVALARALMRRPDLLLLDEPFSALDVQTSRQLRDELLQIHRQFGTTTLLVSHNAEEVRQLADRIVYLERGQLRETQTQKGQRVMRPIQVQQLDITGQITALEQSKEGLNLTIQTDGGTIRLSVRAGSSAPLQAGDWVKVTGEVVNKVKSA